MHATRSFLAVIVLAFGGAVASGAERPNIVVILADDLGDQASRLAPKLQATRDNRGQCAESRCGEIDGVSSRFR